MNGHKMPAQSDIFHLKYTICAILLIYSTQNADAGATQLTAANINSTLESNEIVFINFYAIWCHFSKQLTPLFDAAADEITQNISDSSRVVMGKVDCDAEQSIAKAYGITKYPTLKLFRNNFPSKKEYRGQRSTTAFVEYILKQLDFPFTIFEDLQSLTNLDDKKRMIIGYYDEQKGPEYEIFRKIASNWKDDCQFHIGFGEASQAMHPPGQPIVVFRPDIAVSTDKDETFMGNLLDYNELNDWVQEKCIPLVREITFENAEELTEEGLPLLILFHHPNDAESVKKFKNVINMTLANEKHKVNFLTANGVKFAHPLYHLGKTTADLPLVVIDSFRHMYMFPNFSDIDSNPRKLLEFLQDLYSGKLHREFHYGPDPRSDAQESDNYVKTPTTPPESTFKKLAPSKNRYTLLKDEL